MSLEVCQCGIILLRPIWHCFRSIGADPFGMLISKRERNLVVSTSCWIANGVLGCPCGRVLLLLLTGGSRGLKGIARSATKCVPRSSWLAGNTKSPGLIHHAARRPSP